MISRSGSAALSPRRATSWINSEQLETVDAKAADALCRYTELGQAELGDALNNPAFVEELTGLINQGYWYFDE